MSYDLHFNPNARLTRQRFLDYFSRLANYEVNEDQAWYSNEDTGVYFSFDWNEAGEQPASFNLNYFRPDFFGLEAEPEVRAFVDHFGVEISDPQTSGMGEGPYSSAGFLKGWRAGNRVAIRVMVSEEIRAKVLPQQELERIWKWNFARNNLQANLGEGIFVPKIMLLELEGKVQSFVVWIDGVPVALPKVDFLVLPRENLAPQDPDTAIAPWADLLPILDELVQETDPEYWLLEYAEEMPATIETWFTNQQGDLSHLGDEIVSMDRVVSEEAVEG